jgi:hypothetical protein
MRESKICLRGILCCFQSINPHLTSFKTDERAIRIQYSSGEKYPTKKQSFAYVLLPARQFCHPETSHHSKSDGLAVELVSVNFRHEYPE